MTEQNNEQIEQPIENTEEIFFSVYFCGLFFARFASADRGSVVGYSAGEIALAAESAGTARHTDTGPAL